VKKAEQEANSIYK